MKKYYFIILTIGIFVGLVISHFWPEKPAMAKLIKIRSRNLEYQVITQAGTVGQLLEEQDLSDVGDFDLSEPVVQGITINVEKPVQVTVNDGGNESHVVTTAQTVNDLIFQQKIVMAQTDQVTPGRSTFLTNGIEIKIDRIIDVEETRKEEILFERRLEYDPSVAYGKQTLLQKGEEGEKARDFLVTYENGIEVRKKLLSEKVVKNPQPEIISFGTKIEIETKVQGRASWYATKKCNSVTGGCAAHPYAELGRWVRVTSLSSGKSILVQINDRGPDQSIHPDRVIDLDSDAYKKLAPLGSGTIAVKVELLAR